MIAVDLVELTLYKPGPCMGQSIHPTVTNRGATFLQGGT